MSLEIAGLPAAVRDVPAEATAWKEWVPKALAYRTLMADRCLTDMGAREEAADACAADPLYEMLVFGCIFEPRPRMLADGAMREAGWYPWIPYPFQVRFVRWIEDILAAHPGTPEAKLGRGDGISEKARGMAGSWTFCGVFANRWRWADGFVGGMMSYKEDLVDELHSTDSLFYKVRGYLGLDKKIAPVREMKVGASSIAVPVRPPDWLVPPGIISKDLLIAHPERPNTLKGYTTTERTMTGGRATAVLLDEAAKFKQFKLVWNSISAVTDHRLANSSADTTYGTGFRDLAREAERACERGEVGPSFLRLRPDDHPERDSVWREEIEARHASNPFALQMLAREYDLDYEAGHGSHIYPSAQKIIPKPLLFHPGKQKLDFCIDPGIRDMTAFHLVAYDEAFHRYGLLASYANSGKPAEFYASLVMATPTGTYAYGDEEERIMDWFDQWGHLIRFWIGDPAGKARGGGSATSFYDDFRLATGRLSDGRRQVGIWSSDKKQFRYNAPRHEALRWLLDILDINDEPDTIRTLEALRDHRFRALEDGRETTSPMADPVRTWGHDRVCALEYYAAHRKVGSTVASLAPVEPTRVKLGGSPWQRRTKAAQPWKWRTT